MPVAPTYPGVYIEELPSGVRPVIGVATSITAFVGYAARGPENVAVRLASFGDYERRFGGLDQESELGFAVQQFFRNGGADAIVVRVPKLGAVKGKISILESTANNAKVALELEATSTGSWSKALVVEVDTTGASDADSFNLTITDTESGVTERFTDLSIALGLAALGFREAERRRSGFRPRRCARAHRATEAAARERNRGRRPRVRTDRSRDRRHGQSRPHVEGDVPSRQHRPHGGRDRGDGHGARDGRRAADAGAARGQAATAPRRSGPHHRRRRRGGAVGRSEPIRPRPPGGVAGRSRHRGSVAGGRRRVRDRAGPRQRGRPRPPRIQGEHRERRPVLDDAGQGAGPGHAHGGHGWHRPSRQRPGHRQRG